MSKTRWSCKATNQRIDWGLLLLARRVVSIAPTRFGHMLLAFSVLCTAKTVLANDVPGRLPITHSVSSAGASVASIPIPTLPGAGGLEPKLLLSYSSQNGNTGFGLGWSLNGYSTIVRGSETRDVDGEPGPINYNDNDAFYLDGERIVPVKQMAVPDPSDPWWLSTTLIPNGAIEYRKWIDDGSLIVAILGAGVAPNQPIDSFVVETKSGIRTEFSYKPSAPNLPAPPIYLPSRSIDTAGNYIRWNFSLNGLAYRLDSVEYTGLALNDQTLIKPFATVSFSYSNAKTLVTHLLGNTILRKERLTSVVTKLNNSSGVGASGLVLDLSYTEAAQTSADAYYLTGARLTALGDAVPSVAFDYKVLPSGATWTPLTPPAGLPSLRGQAAPTVPNAAYRLGVSWDNGGPVSALFMSYYSNGQYLSKIYLSSANGWVEVKGHRAPPVPLLDSAGHSSTAALLDIDGDGYTDLLQLTGQGQSYVQNEALGGWQLAKQNYQGFLTSQFQPSELPITPVQPLRVGTYPALAQKHQDLLVKLATNSYAVMLNTPGGWHRPKADQSLNFQPPPGNEFAIGDFNCDGLDDRANLISVGNTLSLQLFTSKPGSQTWTPQTGAAWAWTTTTTGNFHLKAIKIGPSSSCAALLISIYDSTHHQESLTLLGGSQTGWTPYQVAIAGPIFFASDGSTLAPTFLDVNADGMTDIVQDQTSPTNLQQTWIQSVSGTTVSWTHNDSNYGPPPVLIDNPNNYILAPWPSTSGGAVLVSLPSGKANGQTYVSNANGWRSTNLSFAPSVSLVTSKQNPASFQFVDLDGDGLQDVVFNDGTVTGAQLNKGSKGWQPGDPKFTPPLPLSRPGDIGTRATFIDINGDGYTDLIYSYVDGNTLVSSVYLNGSGALGAGCPQGWVPNDGKCNSWSLPAGVTFTDLARGDLGCRFADIDGDGLPDIICSVLHYNTTTGTESKSAEAFLNNALNKPCVAPNVPDSSGKWCQVAPNTYGLPAAFAFDMTGQPMVDFGTQLIDLDGDRLPALIAAYRDPTNTATQIRGIYKNQGYGNFNPSPDNAQLPPNLMLDAQYYPAPADGYQISFMDVDGDGLPDMIKFIPATTQPATPAQAQVYLGNGSNWESSPDVNWAINGDATNVNFAGMQFVDVNGDGRLDIVFNVLGGKSGVLLNTGNGWAPQDENSSLKPALSFVDTSGNDLGVRLIDVTGDGAPDQIQSTTSISGTGTVQYADKNPGARLGMLSRVTDSFGVTTSFSYRTLVDFGTYLVLSSVRGPSPPGIPLVPFSPTVQQTVTEESAARTITSTYRYEGFRFDLTNSVALGFACIEHADSALDTPGYTVVHTTRYSQNLNLVGHPESDRTSIQQGRNLATVEKTSKTWNDQLVGFGPGFLGVHQILLMSSSSETFDLSGSASHTSHSTTSFQYDAWLNSTSVTVSKPGRATQILTNVYWGASDPLQYGQDYTRYGRLKTSESIVKRSDGQVASDRIASFTYFGPGGGKSFLLESESIDVGDYQLNSTTSYDRDARGNIVLTSKEGTNRPRRDRTTATAVTLAKRINLAQYDPTNLRNVVSRTNAKTQSTTFDYGSGGNENSLSLPSTSTDPNGLITQFTYDGIGRHLTTTGSDRVVKITTRYINTKIPSVYLDNLDDIEEINIPQRDLPCPILESKATWTTQAIGFAEEDSVSSSGGKARFSEAKIFDVSNRVIREIHRWIDHAATGPAGPRYHSLLVYTDYKYDTQGRLIAKSLPYFSAAQRAKGKVVPRWTLYQYDALGRRTVTLRSNGSLSRACYDVPPNGSQSDLGLRETLVDANNHAAVIQRNLDGNPVLLTRPDQGAVALSYDPMDRVQQVTSPSGTKTKIEFDGLGNRSRLTDPNAGVMEYRYDAFGELREERFGSAQWIQLDYDELGRKISDNRYDQEVVWTYDSPRFLGLPASTTLRTQNSSDVIEYTEDYRYDDFARLNVTRSRLNATGPSIHDGLITFAGTYTFRYDAYSILDEIVYPTSLGSPDPLMVIKRHYDSITGQLVGVDDITNSSKPKRLWTLQAANAFGNSTKVTLGNGTSEVKDFDEKTGRINQQSIFSSAQKRLTKLEYQYDPVGNLLSQITDEHNLEVFTYDVQNRLTCDAQTTSHSRGSDVDPCEKIRGRHKPVTLEYDTEDRVRSKSDVGKYHYFGDFDHESACSSATGYAPDALCKIDSGMGNDETFDYNEPGGVVAHKFHGLFGHVLNVSYTYDHHVASLVDDSGDQKSLFYYGPSGQRLLTLEANSTRRKETTHLGLYDRIKVRGSENTVTDRFYVLGDHGAFLSVDATSREGAPPGAVRRIAVYQHHDRLGSIILLTSSDGRSARHIRYDPWGKPREGLDPSSDNDTGFDIKAAWTHGFTGQDHIPDFNLVHMTGRIYDPRLATFLSVDPLGDQSQTGGDLNPYLYAGGNPLAAIDPTGLDFWSDLGNAFSGAAQALGNAISSAANAVGSAIQNAAQWVGQNWREIATVAVIAVVTFATAGTGTGPVVAATLAGAAGDATETALYGGSVQDVIGAAIEGAVFGGFSAGLANAGLGWETSELGHGLLGGFQATMSGQDFGQGFVMGAVSQVNVTSITSEYLSGWDVAERVAVSAVVNGVVSEAQGGKFSNGALTGAFEQLYISADQGQWQVRSLIAAVNVFTTSTQPETAVDGLVGAIGIVQQSATLTSGQLSFSNGGGDILNLLQVTASDLTQLDTAVQALKPQPPLTATSLSNLVFQ
ncbi:MAG: RHS repeat-associated core domain-containing protein [Terriglobales bacterium]